MTAGTFTFDLGPGAPPAGHLAWLLDEAADHAGPAARNSPPVLFLRALAAAVAAGAGEVAVSLGDSDAYRSRDMLDSVLLAMPAGGEAEALRRVLGQFEAFMGWDLADAQRRDSHNGLPHRSRSVTGNG